MAWTDVVLKEVELPDRTAGEVGTIISDTGAGSERVIGLNRYEW